LTLLLLPLVLSAVEETDPALYDEDTLFEENALAEEADVTLYDEDTLLEENAFAV
jgi:hypothetical protein